MKINNIRALLESSNGGFFTVDFVKKDGTLRTMNARLGVTKCLKGGVSGTAGIEKYLNVYDMGDKKYKSVNLETVKRIKMNGVEYSVV